MKSRMQYCVTVCCLVSFSAVVVGDVNTGRAAPGAANTWLGKSTAWDAAENWSANSPPQGNQEIVVPSGLPNDPVLTKDTAIQGSLTIRAGARVLVEKPLTIKPSQLHLEPGGALWLGVVRKRGKIVDVALKINTPLTPEVCPTITPAPAPPDRPGEVKRTENDVGPAIPPSTKLFNIAPLAAIKTVPYMTMAGNLVDDDERLQTPALPEPGIPAKGVRYEFRYAKPQTIAAVRWAVVAGPWAILADKDGDGEYETLLRADLEGKLTNFGGVWISRVAVNNRFWPPVEARGIQIVSLLPTIADNYFYDVQILSPENAAIKPAHPIEKDVAELQDGKTLDVPAPPVERQFLKGFHIEPWMFDAPGWIKLNPRPPLSEYPAFRTFVDGLKRMHGNVVNMWPPTTFETRGPGEYESDLLWPSRYDRHSVSENLLKQIADALHKSGIKLSVMQRNSYPKKLEEFPNTGTSKLEAACIDRQAREYLAGVVKEQTASGVDGVGIGFDEQGAWEMVLKPKKQSQFTRKAFEDRFKIPFPEKPADSESFRKWVVFAYEEFASYLQGASSTAKATNTKVFTKTPVHVSLGALWNDRVKVGIAEDIVGHAADLDYMRANGYQTGANLAHYVTAASTKRMIAANKTRGADSLHNCPWTPDTEKHPAYYLDFTPVFMYGPPLSSIFNGGQMPLFWRYNFAFYGGYDKYVEQGYSMLDTLAAWGAKEAKVPRSIAVLKSRASEDWWQIRQQYRQDGNPMDQARGYLYDKWLLEFLFTNGYPFEMYYLDQPQDLKDLSQFQLVILPFPYSIKKEAYDALEKAVKHGTKVLVFERQGETDEWGKPYEKPLLADWIAQGKATFIGDDMPSVGHYPQVLDKVRETVDGLLGARKPLYLKSYGNDVEVAMLEKGSREKFVSVINWTDHPAQVDLGVNNLPKGEYQIALRDLTAARTATLGGKERIGADGLRKFRLSLDKGGVKVLYIHPAHD